MAAVGGRETAEIWQPVTKAGIAVVVVESAMRNGDGQPSWDDPELAERDVRSGLDQTLVFGAPVVLAGGSQGAGVAARLALGGVAPISPVSSAWSAHLGRGRGPLAMRCRDYSSSAGPTT